MSKLVKSNQEIITEINRNPNLSSEEKREQIRDIMLGKFKLESNFKPIQCTHYQKNCYNFHFTCCDKFYDCCRCHNQANMCNSRISIDNITCSMCNTVQSPSNQCINCSIKFGRSYCEICYIWTQKNIHHCNQCMICRIGEKKNMFHCDRCESCFQLKKNFTHKCIGNVRADVQCLFCLESASTSQYRLTILSKCLHPVHNECFILALKNGNYKCPLCRKSMIDMRNYWNDMTNEILLNPLHDDIKKKINVMCYDCEKTTESDWHPIGTICANCGGYNTSKT